MIGWVYPGQEYPGGAPLLVVPVAYTDAPTGTLTLTGSATDAASYADAASGTGTLSGTSSDAWGIRIDYTDAPVGTLTISGSATDERVYSDAPLGAIGGQVVETPLGPIIVGSGVNQQPQQPRPRRSQQQPPQIIIVRRHHDAPTGTLTLSGEIVDAYTPPPRIRVLAGRYISQEPTLQDVLTAQRRARRLTQIREKVGAS